MRSVSSATSAGKCTSATFSSRSISNCDQRGRRNNLSLDVVDFHASNLEGVFNLETDVIWLSLGKDGERCTSTIKCNFATISSNSFGNVTQIWTSAFKPEHSVTNGEDEEVHLRRGVVKFHKRLSLHHTGMNTTRSRLNLRCFHYTRLSGPLTWCCNTLSCLRSCK